MQRVYSFLKTAPGVSANDLAAYANKFVAGRPLDADTKDSTTKDAGTNASGAKDLDYLRSLAARGDVYGQWRLGLRYRDGEGVPQSDTRARELLTLAAAQGDTTAAFTLGSLTPTIPADIIKVTTSTAFGKQQTRYLVDGAGMSGLFHDNNGGAQTMWHTTSLPPSTPPARGLAPSPAWARFDFARPMKFDSILIWNHNQDTLMNRGFRKTRIYGSMDGQTWIPLTTAAVVQLPRASGAPFVLPVTVPNAASDRAFKSVIVAAEANGGNYGAECYGLSAVRFVVPTLVHVVPAKTISVTASSVYSPQQAALHLIDGSGMLGALHDNAEAAQTMWHSSDRPSAQPPAHDLPASPAWIRFDFARPQQIGAILIWNLNQATLTDRGFRKVRIVGSADGKTWLPLTPTPTLELPRANGLPMAEPTGILNALAETNFKSIIIAAEEVDGNYGGTNYGLSAVRFVIQHPEIAPK